MSEIRYDARLVKAGAVMLEFGESLRKYLKRQLKKDFSWFKGTCMVKPNLWLR